VGFHAVRRLIELASRSGMGLGSEWRASTHVADVWVMCRRLKCERCQVRMRRGWLG
jgi:hypothetical protein